MSKVFGESIQDPETGKWKWLIKHEDAGTLIDSEGIFDTEDESDFALVQALKGLGRHSQDQ
jgi:hypothetical protein